MVLLPTIFINKIELTQLPFQISAGMKSIIGKELITDPNTAIFELVKNSYDANASKVTIIFENILPGKKQQSRLLVIDDGDGMSLDEIQKKWLFAGFSEKKIDEDEDEATIQKQFDEKIERNERIFAGAKGIGRFSADRLGNTLIMYTKKEKESTIHQLKIDWKKFKDQKKHFQKITAEYINIKKIPIEHNVFKDFKKGTILEISPIEDEWDRKKLVKLKQFLQRLINPNQIEGVNHFKIFMEVKELAGEDYKLKYAEKRMREKHSEKFLKDDKEFEKIQKAARDVVTGRIKNIVFEKLEIKTTQIKCIITKEKIITTIIDKGDFVFEVEEENLFKPLKNIKIYIFYLNKEAKSTFTKIMGVKPFHFGSIFLYKNGFRIQPFGDVKDDWLNLEAEKGQGYGRNLSRREVIGRVEVSGPQIEFKEASSRDKGVVATKQFELLLEVMKTKALKWLTRYVVEGIDWSRPIDDEKKKTDEEIVRNSVELIAKLLRTVKDPEKSIKFNPELLNIFKEKEIDHFSDLVTNVEVLLESVKSSTDKENFDKKIAKMKQFAGHMEYTMKSYEEDIETKTKEILFLKKSLSPDREIIEDYHHTIGIATGYIDSYIREINRKIREGSSLKEIIPLIDKISNQNQKVKSLVSLVSRSNINLKTKDIRKDIVEYIKQYYEDIIKLSIKRIRFEFQNDHITYIMKFKPLEISMVLDNFLSNSVKANASLIKIRFEKKDNQLRILVGDNGKGIKKENEKLIFKRGFTTTSGSGIGMNHVKNTIEEYDGTIKYLGNDIEKLGKGACFEVVL